MLLLALCRGAVPDVSPLALTCPHRRFDVLPFSYFYPRASQIHQWATFKEPCLPKSCVHSMFYWNVQRERTLCELIVTVWALSLCYCRRTLVSNSITGSLVLKS